MKQIVYKSMDKSVVVKVKFLHTQQLKYTHYGKTWSAHTQCLIYYNGLLKDFSTINKHADDEYDLFFALRLSFEKAIKSFNNKSIRIGVRKVVMRAITKECENQEY